MTSEQTEAEERRVAKAQRELQQKTRADDQVRYKESVRAGCILLFSISVITWFGFIGFRSTSYDNFCYQVGSSLVTGILIIAAVATITGAGYLISKFRNK